MKTDVVEGSVEKVARNKIVEAMQKMKSGKATQPFKVSVVMIVASDKIKIKVMMDLCRCVLDGRGSPDEWKTNSVACMFIGKGDVMSYGSCIGVKLLEHATKIVERVLERRIRTPFKSIYSRKTKNECYIYYEKNAGGISKEGQENIYVFC